jgi:multimeric flavodoxin WrbA
MNQPYILTVLGSPRGRGNSETLADMVRARLSEAFSFNGETVRLCKITVAPCIGCGGCEKTGMCVVKDDMIALYDKIDRADLLFLASPTYFYGVSAQLKAFIDRGQARWSRKYLLKERCRTGDTRAGYLLCTAATHGKRLFEGSELVAKSFFDGVDIPYGGACLIRGVDERGAVQDNPEIDAQVESFANTIINQFIL